MTTLNAAIDFAPTGRTIDPPHPPDHLASAVLASLDRIRWGYRGRPWGVLKTFILAALSFGLLPLLVWSRRFAHLMVVEQQQLWHLAEWLRLRTGHPDAISLRDQATQPLGPSILNSAISGLLPMFAILAFFRLVYLDHGFEFHRLWLVAWRHPSPWRHDFWATPYLSFWRQWTLLLSAGYFLHWIGVCRHANAMTNFANRFNAITADEGVPPVIVQPVGVGFQPFWAAAAIIGLSRGAIWAVPLAMAGVVHARYVLVTSRQTRGEFASRVRTMLLSHRPALDVRDSQCRNDRCRAPVPPGAAFCPRCGARTT